MRHHRRSSELCSSCEHQVVVRYTIRVLETGADLNMLGMHMLYSRCDDSVWGIRRKKARIWYKRLVFMSGEDREAWLFTAYDQHDE